MKKLLKIILLTIIITSVFAAKKHNLKSPRRQLESQKVNRKVNSCKQMAAQKLEQLNDLAQREYQELQPEQLVLPAMAIAVLIASLWSSPRSHPPYVKNSLCTCYDLNYNSRDFIIDKGDIKYFVSHTKYGQQTKFEIDSNKLSESINSSSKLLCRCKSANGTETSFYLYK